MRERSPVLRYLGRFDLGEAVRWAIRGLLIGAIVVLALDLREMATQRGLLSPAFWPLSSRSAVALPPVRDEGSANSRDPRRDVTTNEALLDQDMRFAMDENGRLALTGRIIQGSAQTFVAKVKAHGGAVNTVVINSPGGSLEDAMAMGRLIREKGFATEIPEGALCASSCPLMFAGGVARSAGQKAAIGLHQFYAAPGSSNDAAAALSSAQATTARISRYLTEMGVDSALWLHALDTPPQALYYLSQQERRSYKLVTGAQTVAAARD
ncbi:hypothetical protein JYU29_16200 [Tianweitania sp. BSSL-BM11]|uniref:ATP-dependent Clp protease proteolytic subunit n=1 Tax=Tianweitania aestuarii TaxID=2814886 RepID=A0ABS5S123_9HYPH|nr:hypothetical protein [Tianweitania aestuarii]